MNTEGKILAPKPIRRSVNLPSLKYSKSIGCPSKNLKEEIFANLKFPDFNIETKNPSKTSFPSQDLLVKNSEMELEKNIFISYEEFENEINNEFTKQSATQEILTILNNSKSKKNKAELFCDNVSKKNNNTNFFSKNLKFDFNDNSLELCNNHININNNNIQSKENEKNVINHIGKDIISNIKSSSKKQKNFKLNLNEKPQKPFEFIDKSNSGLINNHILSDNKNELNFHNFLEDKNLNKNLSSILRDDKINTDNNEYHKFNKILSCLNSDDDNEINMESLNLDNYPTIYENKEVFNNNDRNLFIARDTKCFSPSLKNGNNHKAQVDDKENFSVYEDFKNFMGMSNCNNNKNLDNKDLNLIYSSNIINFLDEFFFLELEKENNSQNFIKYTSENYQLKNTFSNFK